MLLSLPAPVCHRRRHPWRCALRYFGPGFASSGKHPFIATYLHSQMLWYSTVLHTVISHFGIHVFYTLEAVMSLSLPFFFNLDFSRGTCTLPFPKASCEQTRETPVCTSLWFILFIVLRPIPGPHWLWLKKLYKRKSHTGIINNSPLYIGPFCQLKLVTTAVNPLQC